MLPLGKLSASSPLDFGTLAFSKSQGNFSGYKGSFSKLECIVITFECYKCVVGFPCVIFIGTVAVIIYSGFI
jgi:hypothetical protein